MPLQDLNISSLGPPHPAWRNNERGEELLTMSLREAMESFAMGESKMREGLETAAASGCTRNSLCGMRMSRWRFGQVSLVAGMWLEIF
jgi:hypothetical protein